MLATNTAALVVLRKGGLDPQSLQQIYNTYVFLKLIAVNGYLPITFTLSNLHIVGLLSWYLILLSSLTVTLSIATLAAVGKFSPSQSDIVNLDKVAASGGPQECDNMRPYTYCYQTLDYQYSEEYGMDASSIDSDAYSMLGFCLLIMVLLVGQKSGLRNWRPVRWMTKRISTVFARCMHGLGALLRRIGRHRQFQKLSVQCNWLAMACWNYILGLFDRFCDIFNRPRLHRWKSYLADKWYRFGTSRIWEFCIEYLADKWDRFRTSRTWRFCIENAVLMWSDLEYRVKALGYKYLAKRACLITFYAFFFYWFIELISVFLNDLAWFATNQVYNKAWNFGQVVAITVWAPPICEFIHLELRKWNNIQMDRTSTE